MVRAEGETSSPNFLFLDKPVSTELPHPLLRNPFLSSLTRGKRAVWTSSGPTSNGPGRSHAGGVPFLTQPSGDVLGLFRQLLLALPCPLGDF